MKSLLNALQEGRLIELPETDKEKSLAFLAHLIEAVPDLAGSPELAEEMIARERQSNTGIGSGVACPHVRATGGGELLCAVGWTPTGIDYGAGDGKKVHLVVMYYIPDAQKNVYLKEISSLAGAIRREDGIQPIAAAADIATVRERLLDWVQAAIEASIPESKARMIRLEARQAVADAGAPAGAPATPAALQVLDARFLLDAGRALALCADAVLAGALEKDGELPALLGRRAPFERAGWRFVCRGATAYGERTLYDYVAVR
ncbi:MAG: PTS sugar transporter subunit IIA [Elusimicrobia bacterium]|nr:PTS sugar transporter subunit IIA [Elusimicrobiota bacterium]